MSAGADAQVVTFGLGEEVFAISVALVREILDYSDVFRIPNGPAWLQGLTDVRGQGVPTVDFRVRLGLAPAPVTPTTRVLVVEVALADRSITLGLVVDRVLDVSSIARSSIEAAPDIGVRWRSEYIEGVVRRAGQFIVLLDVPQIFEADGEAFTIAEAA